MADILLVRGLEKRIKELSKCDYSKSGKCSFGIVDEFSNLVDKLPDCDGLQRCFKDVQLSRTEWKKAHTLSYEAEIIREELCDLIDSAKVLTADEIEFVEETIKLVDFLTKDKDFEKVMTPKHRESFEKVSRELIEKLKGD